MKHLAAFALLALTSSSLIAQESRGPITNADVLSMTKSGLAEQTVVLAIGQGSANFDTSPQALIELKKAGVSDRVLNAMLSASKAPNSPASATAGHGDPSSLLAKALNALGPIEKLTSIQATHYIGKLTQSAAGAVVSSEFERVTCYPDRMYVATRGPTGLATTLVLTAEFNYVVNGKLTSSIPAANLDALRSSLRLDPLYVARHRGEFVLSYDGSEDVATERCDRLRIRNSEGNEAVWSIDKVGRLRRMSGKGSSGEVVTDLSDYHVVDGVNVAFKRHVVEGGRTSDLIITQYELNPAMNPTWFSPPAQQPSAGLRIRVLQEQSVPYVQQTGGGVSTRCNIAGSANTSMTATTVGNSTFGNADTNLGVTMNCNSYDTTMRWPHVLNAMLVEASDGNAYIIACDRAWRWSRCVPLRAGEVFNARLTNKGMAIQAFNTKGQESEPTYTILQSKSLH